MRRATKLHDGDGEDEAMWRWMCGASLRLAPRGDVAEFVDGGVQAYRIVKREIESFEVGQLQAAK